MNNQIGTVYYRDNTDLRTAQEKWIVREAEKMLNEGDSIEQVITWLERWMQQERMLTGPRSFHIITQFIKERK